MIAAENTPLPFIMNLFLLSWYYVLGTYIIHLIYDDGGTKSTIMHAHEVVCNVSKFAHVE